MAVLLRLLTVLACVLVATGLAYSGVLSSLDQILEDIRLNAGNRAPSGEVVLVEIDSKSLREIDTWPWPRSVHAELLERLMDMGADEVAFDVDFSSSSSEEQDEQLQRALEYAGGYAYLAAFEQVSGITGTIERAVPIERFSHYADPVIVNVILDRWGLARAFPVVAVSGEPRIPALAVTLGRPRTELPTTPLIDFSIDLRQIDRISISDILEGGVAEDRISGKRIVVGASAVELQDLFNTPRFGIIPGPMVQIAATETVIAGRILSDPGLPPLLGLLFVLGLISLLLRARFGAVAVGGLVIASSLMMEVGAFYLFKGQGMVLHTAAFQIGLPLIVALAAAEEALKWLHQRQVMQKRLEFLARFDEVSGARSRYGFVEKLAGDVDNGQPMLVLVTRIKRLDHIRGALGHVIADATLKEINLRLDKIAPGYVGRIGDESFAIAALTRNVSQDLGRLREEISFALSEPFEVEDRLVHIDLEMAGASVAEGGSNADDLLTRAELSLGHTDHDADWGITLYDPRFAEQLSRRRQLDLDMRLALDADGLRLAFQPQVDMRTKELIGVEALIRWEHPELGRVSPFELIELAEETGFILEIGRWALFEACRLTAPWNWEGRVAVNVSPAQIELGDVAGDVRAALVEHDLSPHQLEIEVTESAQAAEHQRISQTLKAVRRAGVTVALDDFGTGYSSLSYLNAFPFDMIKIDQSFVRGIHSDTDKRAIVESIILMAKRLGKKVLVEGIETEKDHQLLSRLGCDYGQGYLYGRPVDGRVLSRILEAQRRA